jgi:thioredoxin reductase
VEVIGAAEDEAAGPADWLGEAPEIAEADIAETLETDFLVVGGGNGGMAGAAYASSKGYKVLVLEEGTQHARTRHWYGAIDSEDMLAAGEAPVDRAALRRDLKRYSSGKINMNTFNTWINESAAMAKFVHECYAKYAPEATLTLTTGDEAHWPEEDPTGLFFPVCEHFWTGEQGRPDRNEMFAQVAHDKGGVDIDYNTPMVKLEKDESGKVTGVIAQNTETGKYIRINTSKGVLLACGYSVPKRPLARSFRATSPDK